MQFHNNEMIETEVFSLVWRTFCEKEEIKKDEGLMKDLLSVISAKDKQSYVNLRHLYKIFSLFIEL